MKSVWFGIDANLKSVTRILQRTGFACGGVVVLWSSGCVSTQPAATGYKRETVYFATTRNYDKTANLEHAFTTTLEKKQRILYGTAQVSLRKPHSEGVQKDFQVTGYTFPINDPQHEFRVLTSAETTDPKRPLIVFVHGFNNTFTSAVNRAALYAHDLQPDVADHPVIFSWPSKQKIFGYSRDEDEVLINEDRARQFLEILRTHESASPVVLIGHSMGGRVLTYALRDMELIQSKGKAPKLRPQFTHLILIEPDVNSLYFHENIARMRAICGHVTVYASNHDRALGISQFLHGYEREGELGTQGLAKTIDVIDASAAKTDWIGHSYDGPQLFEDIRGLLHGLSLQERTGKTLTQNPKTKVYSLVKSL